MFLVWFPWTILLFSLREHELRFLFPVPGPMPEPDEEDEFIPSVMSEITDDDDPEIKALAKQIAELERQEQVEKFKKMSKVI